MLFSRKKSLAGPIYLIVGLENPGPKYEMTRHNAGFLAVDLLALQEHVDIKKLKFHALVGDVRLGGERCLLMKPQTMMNLSGDAVAEGGEFFIKSRRSGCWCCLTTSVWMWVVPGCAVRAAPGGRNGIKEPLLPGWAARTSPG